MQRRVMELKRASLVIGTPPATPRNSLLLTTSAGQMFDLQEYLSNKDLSTDTRSQRDTIHEVEEMEMFDHLEQHPGGKEADFKTSQQSMSQHSKSSGSLPSIASPLRSEQDQAIANPATVARKLNDNNSNNNSSQDVVFVGVISPDGCRGSICSTTQSSKSGSIESWEPSGENSSSCSSRHHHEITDPLERHSRLLSAEGSGELAMAGGYSLSHVTKRQDEGTLLFRKMFHQSSCDVVSGSGKFRANKPPLVKKNIHRSATDLIKGNCSRGGGKILKKYPKGSCKPLDELELMDPRQLGGAVSGASSSISTATWMTPRMIKEDARHAQPHAMPPLSSTVPMARTTKRTQIPAPVPWSSRLHGSGDQDSDILLSLEDFVAGLADGDGDFSTHGEGGPPPVPTIRRK